jgi:hypothetical protein
VECYDLTERVADLTRRFLAGERLTSSQVAREYGIAYPTAYATLARMSRVLGLAHHRYVWYIVDGKAAEPWS